MKEVLLVSGAIAVLGCSIAVAQDMHDQMFDVSISILHSDDNLLLHDADESMDTSRSGAKIIDDADLIRSPETPEWMIWSSEFADAGSEAIKPVRIPFTVVSSPRMRLVKGESASMSIGKLVEYFIQRDDGLYELRILEDVIDGITLNIDGASIDNHGNITIRSLGVTLVEICGREALEGSTLDIGFPEWCMRQLDIEVVLTEGSVGIVQIPSSADFDDTLLVAIEVHVAP